MLRTRYPTATACAPHPLVGKWRDGRSCAIGDQDRGVSRVDGDRCTAPVAARFRGLPNACLRAANANPSMLALRCQIATTRPLGATAKPTGAMFALRRSTSWPLPKRCPGRATAKRSERVPRAPNCIHMTALVPSAPIATCG